MPTADNWIPDLNEFGARLAAVRWHMRWNIRQAAVACGVSPGTWRGWELNGHMPRDLRDVVGKIHVKTLVDRVWLYEGHHAVPVPAAMFAHDGGNKRDGHHDGHDGGSKQHGGPPRQGQTISLDELEQIDPELAASVRRQMSVLITA